MWFIIYFPTYRVLLFLLLHLGIFDNTILVDVKWYLIVVFICISLITFHVEHLLMYLLAISISPLEKFLLISFALIKIVLSFKYSVSGVLCLFSIEVSCQIKNLQNFSNILYFLFTLLVVFLEAQKFLIFKESNFSILWLFCCCCCPIYETMT